MACEVIVFAGEDTAVVIEIVEFFVEDFVDEGAFARARCTGDAGEETEGNFDVDVVEVVCARACDLDGFAVFLASFRWDIDFLSAA